MIIQKMIFPKTRIQSVRSMYYFPVHGDIRFLDDVLQLKEGAKISFNGYFNSFYETYWSQYTNLDMSQFTIKLVVDGKGLITAFRDSQSNGCYELATYNFDSSNFQEFIFKIDLNDLLLDVGRIFFDIAAERDTIVREVSIVSNQESDKGLSVGLCTFNREEQFCKNLVNLVELAKTFKNLRKIFIVNQGDEFSNRELLDLISANPELIQVYKQGNLGGAGGFTRTMYEAIQDELLDYHLLMDDDVIIEKDVIETAFSFASLAKKPIAVGGQMLDSLRPHVLYEYGGLVDRSGYITSVMNNTSMEGFNNLYLFKNITKLDFNPWWFCMIPTQAIKELKFSAPIFIRGDDEEYGIRLKENGVETVGLPGVGLWHEPFYVKVGGWQYYYDYRNRFIMSSCYPNMKPEEPNVLFLKLYNFLLVHDYQSVKLILEAIKDYAKGIKLLTEDTETIHAKVSKIAKDYAPKSVTVEFKPKSDESIPPKWDTKTRRINFAKQTAKLATIDCSKKKAKHLWDRHISPQNVNCHPYVQSNGPHTYYYLFTPNKRLVRELLKEMAEARFLYTKAINNNDWHNIEKYKQEDYWRHVFYGQGVDA